MASVSYVCPNCGSPFALVDEAILETVRILHGSGIPAQVSCPHCGTTVELPPPSLESPGT